MSKLMFQYGALLGIVASGLAANRYGRTAGFAVIAIAAIFAILSIGGK